jgi:predicted phosphodiesterase
MQQLFLGDIHGQFHRIESTLRRFEKVPDWKNLYQVGDFGLGFQHPDREPKFMGERVHFIRGNHDDPKRCGAHPNYLGDYGYQKGIFYVGGAWSIDWACRMIGRDWWPDEELSLPQLNNAIELYRKIKPKVVMSHTCPESIVGLLSGSHKIYSGQRTEAALQSMLDIHRPETWVFGHWHFPFDRVIGGTRFVCLMPNEAKII